MMRSRRQTQSRGTGNSWKELKLRKSEGKHVSGDLKGLVIGGAGSSSRGWSDFPYVLWQEPKPKGVVPTWGQKPFYIVVLVNQGIKLPSLSQPGAHHSAMGKIPLWTPRPETPTFRDPQIQMLLASHN